MEGEESEVIKQEVISNNDGETVEVSGDVKIYQLDDTNNDDESVEVSGDLKNNQLDDPKDMMIEANDGQYIATETSPQNNLQNNLISMEGEESEVIKQEVIANNDGETVEVSGDVNIDQLNDPKDMMIEANDGQYTAYEILPQNNLQDYFSSLGFQNYGIPENVEKFTCEVCNNIFSDEVHLNIHKKIHLYLEAPMKEVIKEETEEKVSNIGNNLDVKPYQCEYCTESFKQLATINYHKFNSHGILLPNLEIKNIEMSQCNTCPLKFETAFDLKMHMSTHNNNGKYIALNYDNKEFPYACTYDRCCYMAKDLNKIKAHRRGHTGEKPYKCKVCERPFRSQAPLIVHERIHTGEKPFTCDVCQKTFRKKWNMITHKRGHTGEKPYACDKCSMTFAISGSLKSHQSRQNENVVLSCSECTMYFCSSYDIQSHKRKIHPSLNEKMPEQDKSERPPFLCDVCNKSFTTRRNMCQHKRVHTGEKPYSCDKCSKSFYQSSSLKKHKERQNENGILSCSECSMLFCSEVDIKIHKRKNHPNLNKQEKCIEGPPFKCDLCDKTFTEKWNMTRHKKMHAVEDGGRPFYQCDICQKSLRKRYNLVEHRRLHTGEKPYSCDTCSMSFNRSDSFSVHKKRQSENGIMSCSQCSMLFCSNFDLERHKRQSHSILYQKVEHTRVQTEEKTFSCEKCSKSFSRYDSFRFHKEKQNENSPLSCSECPMLFCSSYDMKLHKTKEHRDIIIKCKKCLKIFSKPYGLTKHESRGFDCSKYSCDLCPEKFSFKSKLRIHLRSHFPEELREMKSPFNFNNSVSNRGVQGNIATNNTVRENKCQKCQKTFSEYKYLRKHESRGFDCTKFSMEYSCKVCSQKFRNVKNYIRHEYSHKLNEETDKSIQEQPLHQNYNTSTQENPSHQNYNMLLQKDPVYQNYNMTRNENEFTTFVNQNKVPTCHKCLKTFSARDNLGKHLRHVDCTKPEYSCDKCDRKFKSLDDLTKHQKSGCKKPLDKKYHCEKCDKYFAFFFNLVKHQNNMSCKDSRKEFKYQQNNFIKKESTEEINNETKEEINNSRNDSTYPQNNFVKGERKEKNKEESLKEFREDRILRNKEEINNLVTPNLGYENLSLKEERKEVSAPEFNKNVDSVRAPISHEITKKYSCDQCGKFFHVLLNVSRHKKSGMCTMSKSKESKNVIGLKMNSSQLENPQKEKISSQLLSKINFLNMNKSDKSASNLTSNSQQKIITHDKLTSDLTTSNQQRATNEIRGLSCEQCPQTFSFSATLKKHRKVFHESD